MPWTATVHTTADGEDRVYLCDRNANGCVDFGRRLTPTEARALAAELVRAADEAEPRERSCFTCRHNHDRTCDVTDDDPNVEGVDNYIEESGCNSREGDAMPTNRTLACPGWEPKP